MTHPPTASAAVVGLPLAVAAGLFVPVQGRINGALGAALARRHRRRGRQLHHRPGADVVPSRCCCPGAGPGWPICLPCGNAASRATTCWPAASAPFFVFAQSFTVGLLGVALFTVAAVTGQTLSGLLVDRIGIGPAGGNPSPGSACSAAC